MNTKKKNLSILGPYDRYNYGDLLFPYIIEKELQNHFDSIDYYSTSISDLTLVGGKKTKSFKNLYDLDSANHNTIIVAGGESLIVSWGILCSYLKPTFKNINFFLNIIDKIFGRIIAFKISNYIGRVWLRGKSYLPLSISKNEMKNIDRVFYNSLGGIDISNTFFKKIPKLELIYKNVDYLSVRDKKTKSVLFENNISSYLVPDCAILMSKHFNVEYLETKISGSVKNIVSETDKYCFFQVNKVLGDRNIETILQQLEDFYIQSGITVFLCPVGIALGHNDYDALSKIDASLKAPHQIFTEDISIWDIMYLIANSKIFIGTSLHGVITAMSFKVPYLGIEVKKVDYYLQTWGVDELNSTVPFNFLSDSAIKALKINQEKLQANLNYQALLVEESFKKMH